MAEHADNGGKGYLTLKEITERFDEFFPGFKDEYHSLYAELWTRDEDGNKILKKDQLCKASYDLHLGKEVYKSTWELPKRLDKEGKDTVSIEPGEFALLPTLERVRVPKDMTAFISFRFSIKNKGLVNISGFHVDPGYEGNIVFSVYNAGPKPIMLRFKQPVFMIFFAYLSQSVPKGYGSGQGEFLKPELIDNVRGPSVSLPGLDKRVDKLETYVKLLVGLLIAILGSLIGVILSSGGV